MNWLWYEHIADESLNATIIFWFHTDMLERFGDVYLLDFTLKNKSSLDFKYVILKINKHTIIIVLKLLYKCDFCYLCINI